MKPFLPKAALAALVLALPGGSLALQGQILLAGFEFSDAPLRSEGVVASTSTAETGVFGGTATVANPAVDRGFAELAASVGGESIAQISNVNNTVIGAEYFQFVINFGGVAASEITFDELVFSGRTGIEWNADGTLGTYAGGRASRMVLRSDLDGYTTDIDGVVSPSFGNTDTAWATTIFDLSALSLTGTETEITFRAYVATTVLTGTQFHRTQLNSVELIGIPEPRVYAALFGLLALGFVAWRRRR